MLFDQSQRGDELRPQYLAEVDEAGQDLKLGCPWQLTSMPSVLCIQLVKVIYQRVLLAQCDGIVKEASADDLHHPLDLQACERDLALA